MTRPGGPGRESMVVEELETTAPVDHGPGRATTTRTEQDYTTAGAERRGNAPAAANNGMTADPGRTTRTLL